MTGLIEVPVFALAKSSMYALNLRFCSAHVARVAAGHFAVERVAR